MPDDEDRRFAVLASGRAPTEGFGNEAPGHGSPPADEGGGAGVDLVAGLIDHEAEAADAIFVGRDEEATLLSRGPALAARVATVSTKPGACFEVTADATIQSRACPCSRARRSFL